MVGHNFLASIRVTWNKVRRTKPRPAAIPTILAKGAVAITHIIPVEITKP